MFVSSEDVTKSKLVFGINNDKFSPTKVVTTFLKDKDNPEKLKHKNNILIHLIESGQVEKDISIPLKDKCNSCDGKGFNVTFAEVKTIEISCPSCNGTGFKIAECSRCSGTGKIGETPCFVCKGRGTYIYKKTDKYPGKTCIKCGGLGMIKKLEQETPIITNVHICKKCNGLGIDMNIGTNLGDKLKEKLKKAV